MYTLKFEISLIFCRLAEILKEKHHKKKTQKEGLDLDLAKKIRSYTLFFADDIIVLIC